MASRHDYPKLAADLRAALPALSAVSDQMEGDEDYDETRALRAWQQMEEAFDALDSALRHLESEDDDDYPGDA